VNCLSCAGGCRFQKSLSSSAISTSFTSGLPSRETCLNGPLGQPSPPSSSAMCTFCLLAVVQTPIVGRPRRIRSEIGT